MAWLRAWREWIGAPRNAVTATVVLCGVAFTAALFTAPSRDPLTWFYWENRAIDPIEQESNASQAHFAMARAAVRRVQLRDSLRALARPGVTVVVDGHFKGDSATKAATRLREAWKAFAIQAPAVPVVLSLRPSRAIFGPNSYDVSSFSVLPRAPGEPCIVAALYSPGRLKEPEILRAMRRTMFSCALFARHGLPGAGVQQELRRLAWAPAPLTLESDWYDWGWMFAGSGATINYPRGGPAYLACRAGRLDGCDELPTRQQRRFREIPPGVQSASERWSFGGGRTAGEQVLALLELSIPRDQFDRLWHDDRPFAVALHAVTGRTHGQWMQRSLLRRERPLLAAFSPTSPLVLRALLFTLLAAAVGAAVHSRRTGA